MSVKTLVRKAAFKAMGCVEIPYGGKVGMSPEEEQAAHARNGLKPVFLPDDPRFPGRYFMSTQGGRNATPEEVEFHLGIERECLERHGLTFAEPGDQDGFLVKWKNKRDRERMTFDRLGSVSGTVTDDGQER